MIIINLKKGNNMIVFKAIKEFIRLMAKAGSMESEAYIIHSKARMK